MVRTRHQAKVLLAALTLALIACFGARAEAARQEPQPQPGVEQSDDELIGGAAAEQPGEDVIEPDEAGPDEDMPPDVKKGGDGSAPPQSAQENKQDKLDLSIGEMPLPAPERPKVLAKLYEQLGAAKDATAAEPITESIETLWGQSGSDTVDLLMSRAERFVKESDLDLALRILDATIDIAPDDAEAWRQRATVHYLQKDYELALADLRHVLDLDPKHYKAINDLGVVLEAMGSKKEALEAYRKALAVNPFLDETRRTVEELSREVDGQDI
jgi:tetratricopeptide (TPR) repeat protein